eukprot:COSAG02_NODE_5655_length_4148_cov_172.597184_1_plen_68_part_00
MRVGKPLGIEWELPSRQAISFLASGDLPADGVEFSDTCISEFTAFCTRTCGREQPPIKLVVNTAEIT